MTNDPTKAVPAIPLTQGEQDRISALPDTDQLRTNISTDAEVSSAQGRSFRPQTNWLNVAQRPGLNPTQQAFVLRVGPQAEVAAQKLGVPVSGVLGQLALESGWGQSKLAQDHNNFGGIKATPSWNGDTVTMDTYEKDRTQKIPQVFRSYPTVNDYMNDYMGVISHPRYNNARGTNDAYGYALALGKSGYHQDDPDAYAQQVQSIAQRLGLK